MKPLSGAILFRLVCIALLWLALAWLILSAHCDFFSLFSVFASGIVVFVPLYKKYIANGRGKN